MKITHNGKNHIIKNEVWERYLKTAMADLEYDTIEDWNQAEIEDLAKSIWLDDEGYTQNEEQENLIKKTANQKLKVDKNPEKPKKTTSKSKKVDEDKVKIIQMIKETLENDMEIENISIENEQKLITFNLNGSNFKLNLTKTREKKA